MRIKAGDANKTLISVSRLQEVRFDTNLTKNPHLRDTKTGERIRRWANSEGDSKIDR